MGSKRIKRGGNVKFIASAYTDAMDVYQRTLRTDPAAARAMLPELTKLMDQEVRRLGFTPTRDMSKGAIAKALDGGTAMTTRMVPITDVQRLSKGGSKFGGFENGRPTRLDITAVVGVKPKGASFSASSSSQLQYEFPNEMQAQSFVHDVLRMKASRGSNMVAAFKKNWAIVLRPGPHAADVSDLAKQYLGKPFKASNRRRRLVRASMSPKNYTMYSNILKRKLGSAPEVLNGALNVLKKHGPKYVVQYVRENHSETLASVLKNAGFMLGNRRRAVRASSAPRIKGAKGVTVSSPKPVKVNGPRGGELEGWKYTVTWDQGRGERASDTIVIFYDEADKTYGYRVSNYAGDNGFYSVKDAVSEAGNALRVDLKASNRRRAVRASGASMDPEIGSRSGIKMSGSIRPGSRTKMSLAKPGKKYIIRLEKRGGGEADTEVTVRKVGYDDGAMSRYLDTDKGRYYQSDVSDIFEASNRPRRAVSASMNMRQIDAYTFETGEKLRKVLSPLIKDVRAEIDSALKDGNKKEAEKLDKLYRQLGDIWAKTNAL